MPYEMLQTDNNSAAAAWLDMALRVSLFLLAFSAPLSIAATQTAWSFALLFWIIRAFFVRPAIKATGMDLAVLAFVGLTLISSVFSYEPQVSLRKMVAVSLVTIAYLFSGHVRDKKMLERLVVLLLAAGIISTLWTFGTLAVGKNLKIESMTPDSPLHAAKVLENDTILSANGKSVSSPEDLTKALLDAPDNGGVNLLIYHYETIVAGSLVVPEASKTGYAEHDLGILKWSRGRDTRASGFFGQYVTYAEALQLVLSLAFGLLIAAPGSFFSRNRVLLAVAVAAFCGALFLTITRASWAAFLVSAFVILLCGTRKKTVLIALACVLPLVLAAGFYLQQKRNVSFIDTKDGSTTWRTTVWREAVNLLVSNPRHLAVGVGMDSMKTRYLEWHMFDDGRLPLGHMHSTPLQFAVERGVPALIAWLVWMFLYLRMLWRTLKRDSLSWIERGVLLGCLGGSVGFLTSGLVHYNWGDSEVAMIFYVFMGLAMWIYKDQNNDHRSASALLSQT